MVKHNDAGGGMTVKEAVITSVKVATIIAVLYLIGYFAFVGFGSKHAISVTLGRFLVKTLYLYPNRALGDLNTGHILDMSRTILLLDIIFISIALYLKSRKKQ